MDSNFFGFVPFFVLITKSKKCMANGKNGKDKRTGRGKRKKRF